VGSLVYQEFFTISFEIVELVTFKKKFKNIFILVFLKLKHLPIVLQLWSAIDFPYKFFSHMNFMKTSFSCCIKLLIWTWLEFLNLIQNGQNSFNQCVLILQLHIIIMLARLLWSNIGKQTNSQLMHYVIATSS
jgi:hypothetical protein